MEDRGDEEIITISSLEPRHAIIKQLLTCPICKKHLREATIITECLHLFCSACIREKITEEGLHACPVCNVDLGVAPLQKLRPDNQWRNIINAIKFSGQPVAEPQASEEAKEPEALPLESVERKERSPRRRKKKSISSVTAREASTSHPPANVRRQSKGREALLPRSPSLPVTQPVEEPNKDLQNQTSSHPLNPSNGTQERNQASKTSIQENPNDKRDVRAVHQSAPSDANGEKGKNDKGKGKEKISNFVEQDYQNGSISVPKEKARSLIEKDDENRAVHQSAPSDAHGDKGKNDKGKGKEKMSNFVEQDDQNGSISVPKEKKSNLIEKDDENGSVLIPSESRSPNLAKERPRFTVDLNIPVQVHLDPTEIRLNHVWFTLVASDKQRTYMPLPQIPQRYLKVKDRSMPAAYIRKYLVKKLSLHNEDEVELSLRGRPISPAWPMQQVVDLWMQTTPVPQKISGIVGGSGKDFVVIVTYSRTRSF